MDFARRGVYPKAALSGLTEEQVGRYFTQDDNHYEVKKLVRSMIVFGEHDLARRSPFPRIDLVMSRNVLIYFAPELQRRALQLFAYSLRDGGYMVLGKAETTTPLGGDLFVPEHREHKVYRRQGERFLMPPTIPVGPVPTRRPADRRATDFGAGPKAWDAGDRDEGRRTRKPDERLLNRLPVGVVLVDQRYDIQIINSAGRSLLSIRGAAVGEDLLHAAHGVPYAEVRNAIDSAFKDGISTTGEFSVEEATSGEPHYLQLVCLPQRIDQDKGLTETVLVVVNDVTDIGNERRKLEERLRETQAEQERLRHESRMEMTQHMKQNKRLIEENRRLEEANRELTSLNEDLQSSYEEPSSSPRRLRPPLVEVAVPPGMRAKLRTDGDESHLPPHVRSQIFSILREGLRNAVEHSGAGHVLVEVGITAEAATGSVEDDGQGLPESAGKGDDGGNGAGLRSMKERAALLGGRLRLLSRPGGGTRVEITVPLNSFPPPH